MPSRRNRCRSWPGAENLECRLVQSVGLGGGILGHASGTVASPNATAEVSVPVSARNLGNRHSIVVRESVAPGPASSLEPAVRGARSSAGKALPVHPGAPFTPGTHESATAYVRDPQPGPVTTGVTGRQGTTGSFRLEATLPGDVNGDGQVNIADLQAFAHAYQTTSHDANYNPAADADGNGYIGIGDGRLLLRNERPQGPKVPLQINLWLGPKDAAKGHTSTNSGGKTYFQNVTILGHTTPGSLVFTDSGSADYTFTGAVLVPNADGYFSQSVHLRQGINNYDFLVIDPYGQQKIQDFPIFWEAFAAPGSKL